MPPPWTAGDCDGQGDRAQEFTENPSHSRMSGLIAQLTTYRIIPAPRPGSYPRCLIIPSEQAYSGA